jgi:hypothetical protein
MGYKPPMFIVRIGGQMKVFEDRWEGTELDNAKLDHDSDAGEEI